MSYKAALGQKAMQTAMNCVAMLAMVTLLLAAARVTGYALALVAFAAVIWIATTKSFAITMPAQVMITVGLLADYDRGADIARPTLFATGIVLGATVVTQPSLQEIVNRQVMRIAHLPGYRQDRQLVVLPRILFVANIVLIAGLAVTVLTKGVAVAVAHRGDHRLCGRRVRCHPSAAHAAWCPDRGKRVPHRAERVRAEVRRLLHRPGRHRVPAAHVAALPGAHRPAIRGDRAKKQASLTFAKATPYRSFTPRPSTGRRLRHRRACAPASSSITARRTATWCGSAR